MAYETFPLSPEFSWVQTDRYRTLRTPLESGNIQRRSKWTKPRRAWQLQWHHATEDNVELLRSFFRDMIGSATPFYYSVVDKIPSPYVAPTVSQVSGGALSSRTLYAAYTWTLSTVETLASTNAGTLTTTSGYFLTVTVPTFPANVDRATIYIGTTDTPAAFYRQTTAITTSGGTWTEPAGGYATGTSNPPSSNALTESAFVHFATDSIEVTKNSSEYYSMRVELEELFETSA